MSLDYQFHVKEYMHWVDMINSGYRSTDLIFTTEFMDFPGSKDIQAQIKLCQKV